MDDMELKKRQEDDLERRIRINKINIEYKKKRRKGNLFIIVALGVYLIIAALCIINSNDTDSYSIVEGFTFITLLVVGVVDHVYRCRCPHCGGYNKYIGKHCSRCGTSLEVFETLIQIDEARQNENQNEKN